MAHTNLGKSAAGVLTAAEVNKLIAENASGNHGFSDGGTEGAPALFPNGDPDTGIWSSAANTLNFSTGGSEAMRIDSSGNVGISTSNLVSDAKLQVAANGSVDGAVVLEGIGNNAFPANLWFRKTRNATSNTHTIVQDDDVLGSINFYGSGGVAYQQAAKITGEVDGTPGASADMPGRLVFSTSADGSEAPTERMRIDSSANVGIGTTAPTGKLHVLTGFANGTAPGSGHANSDNLVIEGSTHSGLTILVPNTDQCGITFADEDDSDVCEIYYNHGSNFFAIVANTAERMRIDSSGNVGIGLTPTANMTGLALEGGALTLKEITTPTADTNYGKLYTKSDNALYFQDGAGVEHTVTIS